MEISAVSSYASAAALPVKVGIAVTKLAMDAATTKSQSLVSMMERSINPNVGANIDIRV